MQPASEEGLASLPSPEVSRFLGALVSTSGKLSLGGTPTALLRAMPSVRPLSLHLKPALSCPGAGPRLILPAQLQTITLHKGF